MKRTSLIAAAVAAVTALAAPAAMAATTVIHAGHLLAEPGKPATANQSIVIENGKVVAIRDGFVAGDKVIDLKTAWVMPGLIDMHAHIGGQLNLETPVAGQIALAFMSRPAEWVLSCLPRMKTLLMEGFTTVRSPGDPSSTTYALRDAVNKGDVLGPRVFATEPQISIAGGDFDPSQWNVPMNLEPYVTGRGNCSGADECVKVVRQEVRRGADFIKLRQSGLPALDPRVEMVESREEVQAIVDTAHQLRRKVAVHTVGTPAFLHMAIEAGVDTVEHGPLDDQSIVLMKKHGVAYTPTLLAAKMIDYRFDDASQGAAKAYRAGVPIIFGTDLGIMGPERSHEEFALLAAAGIPPEQVLRAATVNAAVALDRGDSLGSIAPGKFADVIALNVDPVANIGKVGTPEAVTFVMKEGVVFKDAR